MAMTNSFFVAVASSDGRLINQHFGHAERFLIYQANSQQVSFIEERVVSRYCFGADTYNHPFEEERFMAVANVVKDCKYILVSRIGTVPEKRLQDLGVIAQVMYDYIDDGIQKIADQEKGV